MESEPAKAVQHVSGIVYGVVAAPRLNETGNQDGVMMY
jgi:hypothetical protein